MFISKELFGRINGQQVYEYTFKNSNGIEMSCLNYGCAITRIIAPDRRGKPENIVLGFRDLASYQANSICAGVAIGRVAGRIKNAQFELEGKNYTLAANSGKHHLHGGQQGFHHVVWDAAVVEKPEESIIQFSYTSGDGEEGYPGTLIVIITYTLNNKNELVISYQGQSDQTTLFNPTNHSYFNLSGNLKQDISEHILKINSSGFWELGADMLPTGKLIDVKNTVFDFRTGRKIIEGLNSKHVQNKIAGQGYDHPYVLNSNYNEEIVLYDEKSGRSMVVETDAVGVVLYTGNQIPGDLNIGGAKSRPYLGLCLETQRPPDAIHHTDFPSCILNKNQAFSTATKFTFGVDNRWF